MTPSGSFIINGAERVIVTQLHRSPGFLRTNLPRKRYQVVLFQNYPFQRFLDGIYNGYQQRNVRLHRS